MKLDLETLEAKYKHWDLRRLQNFLRRFRNIEKLKESFEKSPEAKQVETYADEFGLIAKKMTEEFSVLEKAFNDDVEKETRKYLLKVVEIMRQFETKYGGN